jgi:hypothetical protein
MEIEIRVTGTIRLVEVYANTLRKSLLAKSKEDRLKFSELYWYFGITNKPAEIMKYLIAKHVDVPATVTIDQKDLWTIDAVFETATEALAFVDLLEDVASIYDVVVHLEDSLMLLMPDTLCTYSSSVDSFESKKAMIHSRAYREVETLAAKEGMDKHG